MENILQSKHNFFNYYSNVEAKNIEWLWYPYIPYGKITLIQGDPGDGKSTFILNLASILTNGGKLPNSNIKVEAQTVIYQYAEDDISDTIKPRLISAGADCNKIAYIIDNNADLTLLDERIEKTINKVNSKLVILDPLQSFLQDADMCNATKMRSILNKISKIATKYKCAIVFICHMNKNTTGKNLYRTLGSIDITAIARSILMVYRDENYSNIRYVIHVKSSLAPEGEMFGFTFKSTQGLKWLDCKTINKLMLMQSIKENNKRENCISLLKSYLSDREMQSSEIIENIKDKDISERTLYSVKKELGIISYKFGGIWYWKLPNNYTNNEVLTDG